MKKSAFTLAALMLALPATAGAPSLESVAGNIGTLVKGLKKKAEKAKSPVKAAALKGIWQETNCEDVVFEKDAPALSNPMIITSITWIHDCRPLPIPGGGCIPEHRAWHHLATVTIEIVGRAKPAPREVFEVCMTGPWLKLKVKESPFQYDVKEKDDHFTLTRKKAKK